MSITTVNVSDLCGNILAALTDRDKDRNVRFHIQKGLYLQGDEVLIEILLTNLLENAWKYTSNTKNAAIEIGGNSESLYVMDNGAGFMKKYEKRLFVPFERAHGDDEFKGEGIGLTTVKRIVDRHGWEIKATSSCGEGAVFSVITKPRK